MLRRAWPAHFTNHDYCMKNDNKSVLFRSQQCFRDGVALTMSSLASKPYLLLKADFVLLVPDSICSLFTR